MDAFLISTLVVGLAEIGDKTQILSLMLAARFQRPVPIILGILVATLANHAAISIENAKLMVRSAIIQEMHHRVKNSLQTVASLLRLQMHILRMHFREYLVGTWRT